MPTLNYNPVPSVAASPSVGGNYLNVQATPAQFGAPQGQALENLGHVFEQAGTRLADVAIQRQGIFNRVAADEAMNNWQDATNKLLYGDPNVPGDTGFYGKKGREAMDAYPIIRKQLDDTLQQHRQGLQNPMQQLLFDQESRRIRSFLMSETGRHYDQENNRWTQSVYHGKSELAKQDVARAVANGDVAKMNESIGQWSSAIMKSALTAGHSEEEAKALVGKMVADVVEMQADKLSADDPRAAMQFIQDHRDQFKDPEKFLHLQQRVKAAALKKEAQDIANGVPSSGQSLVRGGALSDIKVPTQYQGLVTNAATNHGVPEELLTRVLHAESGFNPNAVSPTGATGIAQFIQSTADRYGVDRRDPKSSINGAAQYLSDLHKQEGSWAGALTKYLGSDPNKDPSYNRSGAIQLAHALDSGQVAPATKDYVNNAGKITMTEGDSIAVGFKGTGLSGNPIGGRNPQAVLDNINFNIRTNPDWYKGQTVLLSPGTMNDPQNNLMQLIPQQIKAIQDAGGSVILAGADTGKFAGRNAELEKIAKDAGVPFAGPLPTANIHPSRQGYQQYAQNAQGLVKQIADKPQDQLILPPTEPGEYADNEVPGLMGELQRIMKDPRIVNAPAAIKSDLFNAAVKEARTKYNTAWTAQQRDRQLQRQQQQDTDRALIREYQGRMTSDSPNYPTIDEVRKDTRLSESAVKDITGEIMRDTKPETDSKASARNQRLLTIRMDPDYQGEDKITTEKQIREAYNMGQLTRSDRNELIKDFEEQQDPTSPRWRRKVEQVLKGVEVKIVPQIAFMPRQQVYSLDDTAAIRVQNWRQAAEAKIAEYVAAGKNPNELFIPGTKDKPNPDYIGGDQFLSPWVGKLNNKLEDKKPATGAAVKSINEMTTLQELQAAAATNPMLRDAARARALELGLVRPSTPSIEVPMAR